MYKSFDDKLEATADYEMEAFDKIWHEGLISKLKQNCIFGDLLYTLYDFLSNRKQRVVVNGQNLSWTNFHAGFGL